MADVKWIKVMVNIFDDEKIQLIESLPGADSIITIWFKLLCLAGKTNNDGIFMLSDKIAYTDEMLAAIFHRDISTVRMALNTFEQFGMIEIVNNVIVIPNWEKHQNIDKMDKIREQTRERVAKHREKQKQLLECNDSCNDECNVTVTQCNETERRKKKEERREKKEEKDITVSNDTVCRTDVQRVVERWNSLVDIGIKQISKLTPNTKRYDSLNARIKQYGIDDVLIAIDKVRSSDFLQGKKGKGWVISFDWFVLPNNFPKVLEGKYDNKGEEEQNINGQPRSNPTKDKRVDELTDDELYAKLPEAFREQLKSEGYC